MLLFPVFLLWSLGAISLRFLFVFFLVLFFFSYLKFAVFVTSVCCKGPMPAPWGEERRIKGAAESDITLPWGREEEK